MASAAGRRQPDLRAVAADRVRVVMFMDHDGTKGVQELADQNRQAGGTRKEQMGFQKADISTAGFLDCFDDKVRDIGSLTRT